MANNLTGDYEAVLQVKLQQVNAILATLHQARMDKDASPSFPHSVSFRIGDSAAATKHVRDRVRFMQWADKAVGKMHPGDRSAATLRTMSSSHAPPGIAPIFERAWGDLDQPLLEFLPPGNVRGRVECQISNPSISVPPGSTSQVKVHARVRAHFYPDEGATRLPVPIRGEITALYDVTRPGGGSLLRVHVTSDDDQIQFKDESTKLSAPQQQVIAKHVRDALRGPFKALDVNLGNSFAFSEFKTLGSGQTEALVLPLSLSPGLPPSGGLGSVTNHFPGSNEFAVGVSKEYIEANFLNKLKESLQKSVAGAGSLSSFGITWNPGTVEVAGRVDFGFAGVIGAFVSFTQAIKVVLDKATQRVSLQPAGDPVVDETWWLPHSFAFGMVKIARDAALAKASDPLNTSVAGALNKLVSALVAFDQWAQAWFEDVEITKDGMIFRGTIRASDRLDPVVHYFDVDHGKSVSAGASWIPGGRIDTFVWSWVKRDIIPWNSTTEDTKVSDDFIWEKSAEAIASGTLCLQLLGKRLTADGVELDAPPAGEACSAQGSLPPMMRHPYWWMRIHIPFWLPDPPHDFVPNERLAGHLSVVDDTRAPGTNFLVHFPGALGNRPLQGLARALEMTHQRDVSLVTVLVFPTRTFDSRRSEIEERLGPPGERFGAELVLTEDYAGGWRTTFAAPDGPSTYLVNARAEFVWKREGELDPGAVARALDEHALPAAPPEMVRVPLGIEPGMPALDAIFTDERGEETSFRRLRGRRVLLTFWQSWSVPCLRELRRLELARAERGAPLVLAVNGGEEREVLAEVRRKNGLSFPLIHDPEQLIAGLYGIRCWPTTISINEGGFVDRVQLGLSHAAREASGATADAPARR